MGRILKALLALVIAAFLALVAYAYLVDFTPPQVPVSKPVTLDAG